MMTKKNDRKKLKANGRQFMYLAKSTEQTDEKKKNKTTKQKKKREKKLVEFYVNKDVSLNRQYFRTRKDEKKPKLMDFDA